jgi:hypothetical protein
MTVLAGGPSFVYGSTEHTWTSTVAGGLTPYAYQWYVGGSAAGTSASQTSTAGYTDFWIKVHVADAYGVHADDSIYVTVSNCTPPQISC